MFVHHQITSPERELGGFGLNLVITYGCVDGLIALHLAVLAQPVVRLAKGDARQAVRDEAQVDGAAAAEQGVVPCLGGRGRGALDVL